MLKISGLFVYPIKSLGGISLSKAQVTSRGLEHDRRWMLVDEQNRFLSQREIPEMALLYVEITTNGLLVMHKKSRKNLLLSRFYLMPTKKRFAPYGMMHARPSL